MSKQTILAWHFTDGMKYRDGTPLVVGQPCPHIENISICNRGYHASEDILHALRHAPGLYLSRTEHSGDVKRQADKICSQDRMPLWTIDFTGVMVEFVRACAASAKISEKQAAVYANAAANAAVYAANAAAAVNAAVYAAAADAAADAAYAAAKAAAAAANAAYAAANAANAEKMWQSVVLLQLISNEYDRLCEAL